MMDNNQSVASELVREFALFEGKRGIWENHWEEVAQRVLPHYSTTFYQQGNTTPGQKRTKEQYDVTANSALWKFAAAMESMLTPANSKWHKVRVPNKALMQLPDVRLWCDTVAEIMFYYRYSPHSGFQGNMHDSYVSLGAFGTSCLFIDEFNDPTMPDIKGLRYRHVPLGEVFFAANHQGQVDKVYRRFKMTLRQIAQKWGLNALPEGYRQRAVDKPDDELMVLHIVKPRSETKQNIITSDNYRFASYYILRETQTLLSEGGYRCFPYSVSRYITGPGELYGRSPAMNVLPSIKMLNEQKKVMIKQGHRAVDPVLLAHDDGVLSGLNMKPGALNFGGVSADGRPLVHALPTGNLQINKELMDDERQVINDAFLVTLFQILVETPQMTATEVLERAREKGALLSPTMGRFQAEALGPQIEREFDLLMWQNLLPPPPQALVDAQAEYNIEYDAPLNRAMRSDEGAGIMRTMQYASQIAAETQDPSAMDWFDIDTIIPELSDINAAPLRFIRDAGAVAQIRQGRQQQQQQAQMAQALPGIAAMTKATNPKGVGSQSIGEIPQA